LFVNPSGTGLSPFREGVSQLSAVKPACDPFPEELGTQTPAG
jgi:hypothetical protein